jgi:hypothetical protein
MPIRARDAAGEGSIGTAWSRDSVVSARDKCAVWSRGRNKKGPRNCEALSNFSYGLRINARGLCPNQTALAASRMCALVVGKAMSTPVYPQTRSMGCSQ